MSDDHKSIMHAPEVGIDQPTRMHPMVQAAMGGGGAAPDVETMRELMNLQREWEAGEAKKSFTRALVAVKDELPRVIGHDKTVDFTSAKGRTTYTHTSLAAVVDAVTDPLTRHGFSVSFVPQTSDRAVHVTCILMHRDGHSERASIASAPDNSGSKNPAQAVASTITYLQRYTLLSMLGIATSDHGEPPPPSDVRIDVDANLRALSGLKSIGVDQEEAEKHVGSKLPKWTSADLTKLRVLFSERTKAGKPAESKE